MAAIDDAMMAAINAQINAELYSAYLYMAMAADFEDKGLAGGANWMKVQAQEEMTHAQKFFDYAIERGGRVELEAIDKPQAAWESVEAVFAAVLEHERKVTALIHALVDKAVELKDRATENFLQWYVAEQVEEEASAEEVLRQVRLMAGAPGAMFMLDRELGQRTFTPPGRRVRM